MNVQLILIAPYRAFADQFWQVFLEHEARHDRARYEEYEYQLETIIADGPEAIESVDLECDVVIARGFTADDLANRNTYIPVVEVALEAADILTGLTEAQRLFPGRRIAVVGSRNMVMGVERICQVVGIEAQPFHFENREQIADRVDELARRGFGVIIGGVRTVEIARRRGLDAVLLESGRDAMWRAITEAKKFAYISRKERERRHSLSTVLNQTNEGIVFLNRNHEIDVYNLAAARILGVQANRALGKRIDQVLPHESLNRFLSSTKAQKDEFVEINKSQLAISQSPVHILGDRVGTVITFQDVGHIQRLESRVRARQHTRGHTAKHRFEDILGDSPAIRQAIAMAKQYSRVDSNVLISGQTGTGKELFAQSIHNHSPRREGPFVAVNCAALPESLLESELFGYVEGAFTGAAKGGKAGLFELAHRGTILLDEISEMPARLQGHLLRVIQEKEIMRLGHDRVVPIDVRIISAANRDLQKLVTNGHFRSDLYYRLHILHLRLPALDERKSDIPQVVEHWIRWYAEEFGFPEVRITDRAKVALAGYSWPGNFRQLRGVCEQLVVLNQGNVIDVGDVQAVLGPPQPIGPPTDAGGAEAATLPSAADQLRAFGFAETLERFEREKVVAVLQQCGNNRTQAARMLGVSRTTLWRYMQKLGV